MAIAQYQWPRNVADTLGKAKLQTPGEGLGEELMSFRPRRGIMQLPDRRRAPSPAREREG